MADEPTSNTEIAWREPGSTRGPCVAVVYEPTTEPCACRGLLARTERLCVTRAAHPNIRYGAHMAGGVPQGSFPMSAGTPTPLHPFSGAGRCSSVAVATSPAEFSGDITGRFDSGLRIDRACCPRCDRARRRPDESASATVSQRKTSRGIVGILCATAALRKTRAPANRAARQPGVQQRRTRPPQACSTSR